MQKEGFQEKGGVSNKDFFRKENSETEKNFLFILLSDTGSHFGVRQNCIGHGL